MRMKSGGGCGRTGRGPLSQSLRRHLEAFDRLSSATDDDIVQHLRSNYPHHYLRTKSSSLKTLVRSARRNNSQALLFDDGGGGSRKKPRRGGGDGASEERLQRMEMARIRQIRKAAELEPESESESESGESDSDDGAVSTSEDAVYGEKLEPKIDLMKSMLRDSYKANRPKEEKDVEMEVPAREKSAVAEVESVVPVVCGDGGKVSGSVGGGNLVGGGGGNERPRFSDFGGMGEVIKELEMEVLLPLYQPELPRWLGVRPMSGLLLHGPPGCGKTRLAHAIANEAGVPIYVISGPEIVSGVSGSSEENVRAIFTKAQRTSPSIVFIDEIDAIASKRENLQREMERRIVTQLMTCMDESHRHVKQTEPISESKLPADSGHGYVLVIGATNRPDALDSALRRPGRFDREIVLGVPDEGARVEILSVLAKRLRLEGSFDLQKIARSTPGFVGADLTAVVDKAGNLAMRRIADERKSKMLENDVIEGQDKEWLKERLLPEEMEKLAITMQDFEDAVKMVQPSSKREGFSAIPDVKWEDVGGLDSLRQEFDRYIVRRIKYPTEYEGFGVNLETGFLLYGPPGCGKTLIAKAIANEAGANFIHIKGPELLSKYVGDSELAVRTLFSRARTCSPCVLFFDEVDALTTKRGQEGGWVVERLLNQFLIELDGAGNRRGVFVIGATNRPDVMDKALLRPGRFGKLLYVPLPSPDERGLILQAVTRKKPIDASVDLIAIAQMEACDNFSGADLAALANEAALVALEEKLMSVESNEDEAPCAIKAKHFELAITKIIPSVSSEQIHKYRKVLKPE